MSKKRSNPSTSSILETALEEWASPPVAPSLRHKNNFSTVSDAEKVGKYLSLCNSLNPSGGGEFEVRLGIESNGRFQSGLKKEHFRKLANELESACKDVIVKKSVDFFYSYNGHSHQHVRYECDETGLKIERVIKKERQHVFDLEGKATLTYDMRVSLSKEEVMHGVVSFPTHQHPTRRRKKTRITFVFDDDIPWRFDLTTVKEMGYANNEEITTYEAEVELDPSYITLLTNNGFNLNLAQKLQLLLQTYNKFDFVQDVSTTFSSSSASLVLFPIKNINTKMTIRNKINELMDLPRNQSGFPGAMPCAMTRSSQQTITVFSHRVTWKADGERYLLCLFPNLGVFMINRKFDIFDVTENQPEFAAMMKDAFTDGREGHTILDGEVILNLQTNKHDYVIFDMISCNSAKTFTEAYDKRMEKVRTRLANAPKFIDRDTYLALPLQVAVKEHHNVSELTILRQKICQTGPNKFVVNGMYGCDGVVFIPSGAYVPRVDHNMFKVKLSLEQITIDFEIAPLGGGNELDRRWGFYCMGKNKELMCCREQTMDPQQNQLCQALLIQHKVEMRSALNMRLIVECYYDIQTGVWKILKRRTDKNVANVFSVYCQTMETLAEGMIVDTLIK